MIAPPRSRRVYRAAPPSLSRAPHVEPSPRPGPFSGAGLRQEPGQGRQRAQEGLLEAADAGRGGRRLRLRRRQDRASAGDRRGASHPRAARLRRQFLGQPRRGVVRPRPLADELHHRPHRTRRGDGPGREEALQGHPRDRRSARPARRLRLFDLRHRADRRRSRRRLLPRLRALRHAGRAGSCAGLRRLEEPRQQACRRSPARPRDRLARAGRRRPDGRQYPRRVQPFRRVLDGEAAARNPRHAGARLHSGRRALSRHRSGAHRPREHDGLLDRAHQSRPQDGRALGHPLLRGLVLRRLRHLRRACVSSRRCSCAKAPTVR